MKTTKLTSIAQSFASDLAKLPEWDGPKSLDNFSAGDWARFAEYVRRDDGTLSDDDQKLCKEIADVIDAENITADQAAEIILRHVSDWDDEVLAKAAEHAIQGGKPHEFDGRPEDSEEFSRFCDAYKEIQSA